MSPCVRRVRKICKIRFFDEFSRKLSRKLSRSPPRRGARSVKNPPHPLRMAGVWNFSVLQLYSLDSSFAIGLARSADLVQKSSSKIIPGVFGVQNRFLGLENRHLGAQNRFLQPPVSFFSCSWPLSSHFYGFGVDFGWILVALGLEIEVFSW